jgi:hypothetical protein
MHAHRDTPSSKVIWASMVGCTLAEALTYFYDIIPHVFPCSALLWTTLFQWRMQETMVTFIYLRFSLQTLLLETIIFRALIALYLVWCIFLGVLTLLFVFLWWLSCQILSHAERFGNKAILLIHFSARHRVAVSIYKLIL